MRYLVAAVALILIVFGATTMATAAVSEPRVALVIGNGGYQDGPLKNPTNDARLMAETLRGLGFQVMEHIDVSQRGMRRLIRDFGEALEDAGHESVGVFYYAGHGVQARGENYLIPTGAVISRESDLKIEGVSANEVLNTLSYAENRLNIVILDACRNNPYSQSFRAAAQGLAKMDAPRGTLVAYATAPGGVSADGRGDNSPYTLALSAEMKNPGVVAEQMFKQVRVEVMAQTKGEQVPWEESSLTGDFYFSLSEAASAAEVAVPEPTVIRADTSAMELAYWQSIQNSTDPAMFEAYLQSYPEGTFANIARLKRDASIGAAQQETQVAAVVAPPEASILVTEMDATYVARRTSNVRAEPTTGSDQLGRLARDDAVIVTGKVAQKDWYRIAYQGGTAYVFGSLIEEIDPGEIVAYETIASAAEPAALELFLDDYPDGYFAPRVRSKLTAVENAERKEAERSAAEEAQRKAAERKEAARLAAEVEAKRVAAEEAKRKAAEQAARATAEAEAKRNAAEQAKREAAKAEAKRLAAEEAKREEAARKAAEVRAAAAQRQAQERALWDTIKGSNRAVDYQVYLQQFPNGTYAALAKARLAAAERQSKAAEEAKRKEEERKAQQETQTALLVPPEQATSIKPEEVLKNQTVKQTIIDFTITHTSTGKPVGQIHM